ncbi:GNAT family N-acetyltransferase [Virgibacillus ihumii]|uniref:GNAT family N-acetyltransferase n=1 Tax=Virgibacillus ihumii TaxID=2686091 RepID=UPI00157DFED3|nr:GNAT family N-acetyltransferase [Virgibacillus ihumii]
MELILKNGTSLYVREYRESDFENIHQLNATENWNNLVKQKKKTMQAWNNSNIAYVVLDEDKSFVGSIRGMTDKTITLFICEVLIDKDYRGQGTGRELLKLIHSLYPSTRMELLATSTSQSFYAQLDYRPFYGYRKTYEEWDIGLK